MYSMAVLNPDNLPDLGQGNQFTKSPPNKMEQGKGEKCGGLKWGQGRHKAWWGKGVCVGEAMWHKCKDLMAGV